MPIVTTIDNAAQIVEVHGSGTLVLADFLECFDSIVVNDAMSYAKIFDAGDCSAELSDADMMELGACVSAYAAFEPRGPIAIVVAHDRGIAKARRFLNLGGAERPGRIFATKREARVWLALRPAEAGL